MPTPTPTDRDARTVLVAGATGRFGAVAEAHASRGHRVRAMTRDPGSPAAGALRVAGAKVVRGDFDDPESLEAAMDGADAAFATGTAHKAGPDGELRHGRNLARAAAAVALPHLVYVSGDGASPDSPLPLFRAKAGVEERIRELGVPNTILAPVYLMENLFNPWNLDALHAGAFPSPIDVDWPLHQAATADVVALAAVAIERPGDFLGRRVALASDRLSAVQAAEVLSGVLERPLVAERLDPESLPPPLQALFGWLERVGHDVDLEALHREHPEVDWHGYEDWARSQLHRFRELCRHPEPVAG